MRFSPRGKGRVGAGIARIVGVLRQTTPARYPGHEFSIGSPYPDLYPEHLAGGVLFFHADSFEVASLRTFDGNDYFTICITTRPVEILIQDQDSGSP